MVLVDISDQLLELVLCAMRGKVGLLRLESSHQVGGRLDDIAAELEDGGRSARQMARKTRRIRVQADAQQRAVAVPTRRELL